MPTHELPNGTRVRPNLDDGGNPVAGEWLDEDGVIWEDEDAEPIAQPVGRDKPVLSPGEGAQAVPGEPENAGNADLKGAEGVPDPVLRKVKLAISRLNDIADRIKDAKSLEGRFGERGRYQADTLNNRRGNIDDAMGVINEFRKRAPSNNVDAEKVISELGGLPDLTPSKEAKAWLDHPKKGPVEFDSKKEKQSDISDLDEKAHAAATSPTNEHPEPTEGQKEAGNYRKGHVRLSGLDLSIENPAGSIRSGTDKGGKPWSVEMKDHYGYIKGTVGKDKDHLDVFVKPGTPEDYGGPVFVVDQKNADGAFDEHKILIGFKNRAAAVHGYKRNYSKGWQGLGAITPMPMAQFKDWLKNGDTKRPVGMQAKEPPQPAAGIVQVRDIDGRHHFVKRQDLDSDSQLISRVDQNGKRIGRIHRDNILGDDVPTPYFADQPIIGTEETEKNPNGRAFKNQAAAKRFQKLHRLEETHEIKPYKEGFIVAKRKADKADVAKLGKSPRLMLAEKLAKRLEDGETISSKILFADADAAFGGTQAEGKYSPKDAYDAMEAAVNLYLMLNEPAKAHGAVSSEAAAEQANALRDLVQRLPTQTRRDAEMDEFQQFSTPPALAYVANFVANVKPTDTLLEPSAGTGDLAVWARNAGAKVVLNELSPRRAELLQELFPKARVFAENAEQLHNVLPADVKPTVVVMNPPFSSTAGRIRGERKTMNGAQHIEQALKRLVPNGRLVAIVGEGMAADRPAFREWWDKIKKAYNVRANIGISGKGYAKYGTTFDNQILVIDKTGPTSGQVMTGKVESPAELPALLEGIRNDRVDVQAAHEPREARKPETAEPSGRREDEHAVDGGVHQPQRSDRDQPDAVGDGQREAEDTGRGRAPGEAAESGAEPQGGTAVSGRPGADRGRRDNRGGAEGDGDAGGRGRVSAGSAARRDGGDERSAVDVSPASEQETSETPEYRAYYEGLAGRMFPADVDRNERTKAAYDAGLAGKQFPDDKPEIIPPSESSPAPKVVDDGVTFDVAAEDTKKAETPFTESVFEQYKPQKVKVHGAKPHPGKLVQSAAMAAVEPPAPTYTPKLPKEVIEQGLLSDAQLEAVVYAGQAHAQTLPSGERRGFFIGDGTGVGKGREISGIILDNQRQGRDKAVWISFNEGLIKDAKRDFKGVGGDEGQIFWHGRTKAADPITAKKGILFTTYSTLRGGEKKQATETGQKKGKTRVQQIVEWLGKDFDGVIVFDEAHKMGNAVPVKGKRGTSKPSQQALAGIELQAELPKARVVYVSATGATEVMNLAYASRLGLWGEGTPFAGVRDFISDVASGGVAAMELVSRDMKALGMYLARSLSYDGVTYDRLEHELTPLQRDVYNELATAWQTVLQNVQEALKETGQHRNADAKSAAMSRFWGTHQRFFNQIITAMMTPSVIEDMRKQIDAGNAIVIQLTNTNEAEQERQAARAKAEDVPLEEMDFTPRQALMEYVRNGFPVRQFEEYEDENGNRRSRPVKDASGNAVLNQEMVEKRNALLKTLEQIRVPDNPIDEILNAFGSESVAEVTGRRRRFVRERDKQGNWTLVEQKRGPQAALADATAFQADRKKILIFSDAGGTGYSFHADNTAANQRRRIHYILQPGWRADGAVQGFGRTHRTNQASAPHYVLPTTNLKAQKRFVSSIARRLDQLGALTRGQRDAGSQGLFTAADNLESKYADEALFNFFDDLHGGKTPLNAMETLRAMGLEDVVDRKTGGLNADNIPTVPKFLNRLLSLTQEQQDQVFDQFMQRLDDAVRYAIDQGIYDTGMETLSAQSIKKVSEDVVHKDQRTGAETRFVELDVTNPVEYREFERAKVDALGYENQFKGWFRNEKTGKVFALVDLGRRLSGGGREEERGIQFTIRGRRYVDNVSRVLNGTDYRKVVGRWQTVTLYTPLDEAEARKLWEAEIEGAPKTETERRGMLVGVILPIWNRVTGQPKIYRLQTDDGERFLGRLLDRKTAEQTMKNLGLGSSASKLSTAAQYAAVEKGARAILANGWEIKPVTVSGEKRLEIDPGRSYLTRAEQDILQRQGAFLERISWQERFFIPRGANGPEVFARVVADKPVVELAEKGEEPETLFSRNDAASGAFAAAVRAVLSGEQNKRLPLVLAKTTPEPYRAVGIGDLPLVVPGAVIDKMHFDHGLSERDLARLPALMADPVMIFESDTEKGAYVAALDLFSRGLPVVAVLHPNRQMGRYDVNIVASAYPKDKPSAILSWWRNGLLRYIDKERSPAWSTTAGLQLPGVVHSARGSKGKIITKADVVKRPSRENPDIEIAATGSGPDDFITVNGSTDLGEITPELAKKIKRQAGPIRLNVGVHNPDGTGYGREHIEARHQKHIVGSGFDSVESFVRHVLDTATSLWRAPGGQLVLAAGGKNNSVMYVELQPSKRGGADYYRINSAFPVRREDYAKKKGFVPLWEGSEPVFAVSGQQPAFAIAPEVASGQGNSNARGQSSETSIGAIGGERKKEAQSVPVAPRPLDAVALDALINEITATWKNAPKVKAVPDFFGLPAAVQNEATDQGAGPSDIKAAWYEGAIYLVGSNLTSLEDAEESLLHEAYGHYGLRRLFGPELSRKLGELYLLIGGDKGLMRLAKQHRINLSAYAAGLAGYPAEVRRRVLLEELLAHIAQKGEPGLMRRAKEIFGMIRAWLRRHGFMKLAEYGDADIAYLLKQAREAARNGGRAAEDEKRSVFSRKAPESNITDTGGRWGDRLNVATFFKDNPKAVEFWLERHRSERSSAGGPPGLPKPEGDERPFSETDDSTIDVDENNSKPSALFSRKPQESLAEIGQAVRSAKAQKPSKSEFLKSFRKLGKAARRQRLGALTRDQLAEVSEALLPEIQNRYIPTAMQVEADRNEVHEKVGGITQAWSELATKNRLDAERVAALMHETTLAGVDPSKPYEKVIDIADGLKRIKVLQAQIRGRSGENSAKKMAEIADIKMRIKQEARRAGQYAGLVEKWKKLSPKAQRIYEDARDYHVWMAGEILKALEARIMDSQASGKAKRELVAQLRKEFESNKVTAPYFPLARFGDYWVYTQDGTDRAFDMFETREEQEEFLKQMEREGVEVLGAGKQLERFRELDGMSPGFVAELETMLGELGDDPKVKQIRDDVWQLYLKTLPDLSARKHFIHRRKVAGYSEDALRATAMKGFHDAYQLARLRHVHKLERVIEDLRGDVDVASSTLRRRQLERDLDLYREYQEKRGDLSLDAIDKARSDIQARLDRKAGDPDALRQDLAKWEQFRKWFRSGFNPAGKIDDAERRLASAERIRSEENGVDQAADYIGELQQFHQEMLNPSSGYISSLVNTFGFAYFLGASVSSALVNTLQTPIVALPSAAGRYGWGNARKEFGRAFREFFSNRKLTVEAALEGDELKAFREFHRMGVIDKTLAHDLAGLSEQGVDYSGTRHRMMTMLSWFFHHAERLNREVTAMAAYRLARKAGADHEQAIQDAARLTWKTHFNYSASNRARFMRGPWARVAFQFKQYSQAITYLLARSAHQAFKGASPEVKREARAQLGGILAMQFLFAGAKGLPIVGLGLWAVQLVAAALGDDDEPFEWEGEVRQALVEAAKSAGASDHVAQTLGRFAWKGAIDAFTPWSIANRLSMSELWVRDPDKELEGKDLSLFLYKTIGGPMAGLGENIVNGLRLIKDGEIERGLEKMMPVAVANLMKAARYATEGAKTLRGDPLLREVTPLEIAGQAVGLSPSRLSERYDENTFTQNVNDKLSKRRQEILDKIGDAALEGDRERLNEGVEEAQRFGLKNPTYGINRQNVRQSVRMRQKRTAETEDGLYLPRRAWGLRGRYDFAGE